MIDFSIYERRPLIAAIAGSNGAARRVSRGGHEVPYDKIETRFPRTLGNLRLAIRALSNVLVFDNCDLSRPYRLVAAFQTGTEPQIGSSIPDWLKLCLPEASS